MIYVYILLCIYAVCMYTCLFDPAYGLTLWVSGLRPVVPRGEDSEEDGSAGRFGAGQSFRDAHAEDGRRQHRDIIAYNQEI